jgi:hypothetical protein
MGDEDEEHASMANEWQMEHDINDEGRGVALLLLVAGSVVALPVKIAKTVPRFPFSSDRIVSGLL